MKEFASKDNIWKFKPLLISAPFGKYINLKASSSVYGSYTIERRTGLLRQIFKTFRPIWNRRGYINRIGLRNCGIYDCTSSRGDSNLISLAAIKDGDWELLFEAIDRKEHRDKLFKGVVLNLSCPNEKIAGIREDTFKKFNDNFEIVIKLSPRLRDIRLLEKYLNWDARSFIISNTIATKRGGVSGLPLLRHNIKLVKIARRDYGYGYHIVGGGGIQSGEDVYRYSEAGADSFAIGTGVLNFWHYKGIVQAAYECANIDVN